MGPNGYIGYLYHPQHMLPCSCDDGELMHFTRCSHSLWSESSKSSTKMTAVQFPSKSSSTRSTSLLGRLRRTRSSSSSKSTTSTVSILNPLFYTDLISFLGDKVLGQEQKSKLQCIYLVFAGRAAS